MNSSVLEAYDTDIMELRKEKERIENEIRIRQVKYKDLTLEIHKLPKDIQVKMYVYAIKKFRRDRILDTPLVPSWVEYKRYIDLEMKKAILDNVHFLHLEFNTLPENKEWIPGCQCDFCKDKGRDKEWNLLKDDEDFFYQCIHCYDYELNYWNQGYIMIDDTYIVIFNNEKGSFEDPLHEDPHESPIYFTEEVCH
uniref:Uncharacterized protein n=1 Tax=viral metagenome TaxID=1070528 RepID=A0A6C0L3F4_9ZZZZ|tara:strand:- start:4025 stop:4609 length:585 start_codon:yes stop_codon:yes gene_type:complete